MLYTSHSLVSAQPSPDQFNLRCVTTRTTNLDDPIGKRSEFVIDLPARKWSCLDCTGESARDVKPIQAVDADKIVLIDQEASTGDGSRADIAAIIDRKSEVMTVNFSGVQVETRTRFKRKARWQVVKQCSRSAFSGWPEPR
jgi:hypothetical protein